MACLWHPPPCGCPQTAPPSGGARPPSPTCQNCRSTSRRGESAIPIMADQRAVATASAPLAVMCAIAAGVFIVTVWLAVEPGLAQSTCFVPAVTSAPCHQAYVFAMGSCYYVWIGLRRRPRCKRSTIKSRAVGDQGLPGRDPTLLLQGKRHFSGRSLPASDICSLRSRSTSYWHSSVKCSLRPDR
jgi:hypothetical protein